MSELEDFRFVIVARPGQVAQTLDVSCANSHQAIDAAIMFAEEAAAVELWREHVLIWSSETPTPGAAMRH
jgi:hypothetical protein